VGAGMRLRMGRGDGGFCRGLRKRLCDRGLGHFGLMLGACAGSEAAFLGYRAQRECATFYCHVSGNRRLS